MTFFQMLLFMFFILLIVGFGFFMVYVYLGLMVSICEGDNN